MNEDTDVTQDSSPDTDTEPTVDPAVDASEGVTTPVEAAPDKKAAEKVVPYDRFKEVNDELARLKGGAKPQTESKGNDIDQLELIKLGKKLQDYSDEEIDFVTDHAKSKNPEDILKALDNEMVRLAIEAKRAKVEKERLSLKPSGTQPEGDKPKTLQERLANASIAEKEKILTEAGLYKTTRPRADRTVIGGER